MLAKMPEHKKTEGKDGSQTVLVTVRLEVREVEELDKVAAAHYKERNPLIVSAIANYLRNDEAMMQIRSELLHRVLKKREAEKALPQWSLPMQSVSFGLTAEQIAEINTIARAYGIHRNFFIKTVIADFLRDEREVYP